VDIAQNSIEPGRRDKAQAKRGEAQEQAAGGKGQGAAEGQDEAEPK